MQEAENESMDENLFEKSVLLIKTNRTVQIVSVLTALVLLSIPAYSMLSKSQTPDDEYQRELEYIVDFDSGYITWDSNSNLELNDDEVFSLKLSYDDFPEDAKAMNIVSIWVYIEVLDSQEDNEETSGLGCSVDSGEDALDSASIFFSSPNSQSELLETQYSTGTYIDLLDSPEFTSYPFITGYTVEEIEEMYETDEEDLVGEYNLEITGLVEAGDSTLQCERQDPSVTVEYMIELIWIDAMVMEWNGDLPWF